MQRWEMHNVMWMYDCSVYCNGKEYEPSRRIVLTKRMLSRNLIDIFPEISQHFGVIITK